MTAELLVRRAKAIASGVKTLYVRGGFGQPLVSANKIRLLLGFAENRVPERTRRIWAADPNTFAFDCSGLIKGILWGWTGDSGDPCGGAVCPSNGVPDLRADDLIAVCRNVSEDFSNLVPGEVVWLREHIGIYIGEGLVVESSPLGAYGVQQTACGIDRPGYLRRDWEKHGKLPYVTYDVRGAVR